MAKFNRKFKRFHFQTVDLGYLLKLAEIERKEQDAEISEAFMPRPVAYAQERFVFSRSEPAITRKTKRSLIVPIEDAVVCDHLIDAGYGLVKNDSHSFVAHGC